MHKFMKRGFAVFLLLLVLMSSLCVPAFASMPDDDDTSADSSGSGTATSFYKMSSVGSAYFSDLLGRTNSSSGATLPNWSSASAGGVLGYCEEAEERGFWSGFGQSKNSASTNSYSYAQIFSIKDGSGSQSEKQALYRYVKYGQFLRNIGFDGTASNGGGFHVRTFSGHALSFAYTAACFAPRAFRAVIHVMQALNPFKFVDTGVQIANLEYADTDTGNAGYSLGVILTKLYTSMREYFVPVTVTFLFIYFIVTLVFKNLGPSKWAGNLKHVKKYVLRLLMIFLGIPLCAALYTDVLGMLETQFSTPNFAGTRIVCSTFIDFEEWARQFQLATPAYSGVTQSAEGDAIDISQNKVSFSMNTKKGTTNAATYQSLMNSCYNINMASWLAAGKLKQGNNVTTHLSINEDTAGVASGKGISKFNDAVVGNAVNADVNDEMSDLVSDLVRRYADGEFYYASTWEGDVKAKIPADSLADSADRTGGKISKFKSSAEAGEVFVDDDVWSKSGEVCLGTDAWTNLTFTKSVGLSPMAMYNYLSTKFGSNSIVLYSQEQSTSDYTREAHYSVNSIGGGMLGILFYLNAFVLLIAISVLAFGYAFAIFFGNFKRFFLIIPSIFMTMSGSLKMASKLVTHTAMLLLEVLLTMLSYGIAVELLGSLNSILTTPLMTALFAKQSDANPIIAIGQQLPNGASDAMQTVGGSAIMIFTLVVSIVLYCFFIFIALRMRRHIVKTLDEAASAFIDRIFEVQHTPQPDSPSLGSRAAGALAAGAGAGLAQRMMGGGKDEEKESKKTKGTAGADDDGGPPPGGGGGPGGENKDNKDKKDAREGDAAEKDKKDKRTKDSAELGTDKSSSDKDVSASEKAKLDSMTDLDSEFDGGDVDNPDEVSDDGTSAGTLGGGVDSGYDGGEVDNPDAVDDDNLGGSGPDDPPKPPDGDDDDNPPPPPPPPGPPDKKPVKTDADKSAEKARKDTKQSEKRSDKQDDKSGEENLTPEERQAKEEAERKARANTDRTVRTGPQKGSADGVAQFGADGSESRSDGAGDSAQDGSESDLQHDGSGTTEQPSGEDARNVVADGSRPAKRVGRKLSGSGRANDAAGGQLGGGSDPSGPDAGLSGDGSGQSGSGTGPAGEGGGRPDDSRNIVPTADGAAAMAAPPVPEDGEPSGENPAGSGPDAPKGPAIVGGATKAPKMPGVRVRVDPKTGAVTYETTEGVTDAAVPTAPAESGADGQGTGSGQPSGTGSGARTKQPVGAGRTKSSSGSAGGQGTQYRSASTDGQAVPPPAAPASSSPVDAGGGAGFEAPVSPDGGSAQDIPPVPPVIPVQAPEQEPPVPGQRNTRPGAAHGTATRGGPAAAAAAAAPPPPPPGPGSAASGGAPPVPPGPPSGPTGPVPPVPPSGPVPPVPPVPPTGPSSVRVSMDQQTAGFTATQRHSTTRQTTQRMTVSVPSAGSSPVPVGQVGQAGQAPAQPASPASSPKKGMSDTKAAMVGAAVSAFTAGSSSQIVQGLGKGVSMAAYSQMSQNRSGSQGQQPAPAQVETTGQPQQASGGQPPAGQTVTVETTVTEHQEFEQKVSGIVQKNRIQIERRNLSQQPKGRDAVDVEFRTDSPAQPPRQGLDDQTGSEFFGGDYADEDGES